jgi:L-Ala-D/L-Glu epimerase
LKLSGEILELRTRHAFQTARAASVPVRRSVWLKLRDADGLEGWGEAAAAPYYGETPETVLALLPRLGELLAPATDPFALERLERGLERAIGQNPSARAAISAALHDLVGKRLGLPVWKLFGLDGAAAPRSSYTIGLDAPEKVREKVREAAGYPILKIKLGSDQDEELLRLIREEAPEKTLYADANTAWTAKEALRRLPLLEAYRVALLEQPVAPGDLAGLRLLRERSPIPIIADESCKSSADIPALVGAVDGINIKLSKCGSLREALRMVHLARAHGLLVMLGCMVESSLGISAALQLAPLCDYADLDGAALLADDPFLGPGLEPDGGLRLNQEPGLGVALRASALP